MIGTAVAVLVGVTIAAELVLRWTGVGDFPLYRPSAVLDYVPQPDQAGMFRRTKTWAFNDRGMGTARRYAARPSDILLLGDSLVMGGNALDQSERLGPRLERLTGCCVWPLGASSWSLSTELRALQNDPSLHIPATLVIVSNSGDLVAASRWQSEYVQPTHRPVSLLAYAIGKKLAASQPVSSPETPTRDEWPERLGAVLAPGSRRIVWVLYPWEREVRRPVLAFDMLVKALPPAIGAFRIDGDRRWTGTDYGDHFHPSASGYAMLAAIIADRLPRCRANHGT